VAKDPVDGLYDLPLSEFVAARNELAKQLSKSGDKAKAAEVKVLVKPSTSAFALNQVVRKHRAEVDAFLRASDRLARAQLRAMSGAGNDADFRAAVAEQREALEAVLQLAAPALEEAGQAARRPVLEKIARTLRAIVLEESQRALLEAGRLSAELVDQGFDALTAALGAAESGPRLRVVPPAPSDEPPAEKSEKDARAERVKEAREQLARGKAERLRAEREKQQGEDADRAKTEKQRAEREAIAAKKAREAEARNILREKEKAVAAAREKVDSARAEMEAANQEVVDAKRILVGAERLAAQRKERFLERQETLHAAEAEAEIARAALLSVK
jgi:hypothetical protein